MRPATRATKTAIGLIGLATGLPFASAWADGHPRTRVATCRTAQLRAAHGFSNGAAGSYVTPLRLRNVSRTTCSLKGYPRITLLDGRGHAVLRVRHSGGVVAHTVRLAPGRAAQTSLRTSITSATGDSRDCPSASALRIAPPGESRSLRLRIGLTVCRGDADYLPLEAAPRR